MLKFNMNRQPITQIFNHKRHQYVVGNHITT
jgi:hypothetical protein